MTDHPTAISYTLNEWLRFDAPGRYRVYLTSGRVVDTGKRQQISLQFQGRTATSNAVEFDVLPDDPAWDAETLQQALPLYNADGYDSRTQDARVSAVRAVRFLGTPDAIRAMVARYGHFTEYDSWNSQSYYQTRLGLFGYSQPEFVIQEMQRQIADPSFPVFRFFLTDLAQTQFFDAYPQITPAFVANDPVREKERQDLIRRRLKALTDLTEQDRQELAASIHTKSGRARAVSMYALLVSDYTQQDTPAHRKLARALVPVFDNLTPEEQSDLLDDWGWNLLRGPDMLPALRRLYAVPLPVIDSGSVQDEEAKQRHSLALRRLMELSPAEGRALGG